jgi:hypothetical protein
MKTNDTTNLPRRDRQSRAERLTVDLPAGTLTALKVHVAQRETTIREVVTNLVQNEIEREGKRT